MGALKIMLVASAGDQESSFSSRGGSFRIFLI